MRQLSVPVRWAAVVTVTIAASTGCMSIGEDGGKPTPSRSAKPKGSVAEPDGATVAGTGRTGKGGSAAHSGRKGGGSRGPNAPADPSGSPGKGPDKRGPVRGGHLPTPSLSSSGPGAPQQPDPPAPSAPQTPEQPVPQEPDPAPSEPPAVPSASPAAQLRHEAMGVPDGVGRMRTPEASPQVGPA